MNRQKLMSQLEQYKQTNGYYDISAIYADLNPPTDDDPFGLDNTFSAFFGDDDECANDEPEIVKLARELNAQIAEQRDANANAEARQILRKKRLNRADMERLIELGYARIAGPAEDLRYELLPHGEELARLEHRDWQNDAIWSEHGGVL